MKFPYDKHYFPPAPTITVRLAPPAEPFQTTTIPALVDTGADASIVPFAYIEPLSLQADNRKYLRSQWGERRVVDTYMVDIEIGDLRFPFVEIIADELGDEVILGRNLLNKLRLTLDGPNELMRISG
ncbi:retropepsin-like aspartic protease [Anaerolineales bacterium HSG6]|nr:retropepsin-like aspartic protease [Anaerolineales bacterium HSG6]